MVSFARQYPSIHSFPVKGYCPPFSGFSIIYVQYLYMAEFVHVKTCRCTGRSTTNNQSDSWRKMYCQSIYINSTVDNENKLHLIRWWWFMLCTRPTPLVDFLYWYLTEKDSPRVDMSPHMNTLHRFQGDQSFHLLFNFVPSGEATNTNSMIVDPTRTRTHYLPYSRRAR
jgi:hypothetical protein